MWTVCVCRGDDQACVVGSPRGYFDLFVLLCFVLGRGNFSCGVSRVPALEEVVTHLRKHGFLPLMTGDNGTERKLYVVCVCVMRSVLSLVGATHSIPSSTPDAIAGTFTLRNCTKATEQWCSLLNSSLMYKGKLWMPRSRATRRRTFRKFGYVVLCDRIKRPMCEHLMHCGDRTRTSICKSSSRLFGSRCSMLRHQRERANALRESNGARVREE